MSRGDRHPLRKHRDREKGIALLAVLFGLAVLSVLLTASINRSYTHTALHKQITADLISRAEFEATLILAGVRSDADIPEIRAVDARGLVDVNTASAEVLAALLTGLTLVDAEKVAERIAKKRSRARRWTDPRELQRLKLVGFEDFGKLRPHLTVFSGLPAPDLDQIPEDLRVLLERGGYDLTDASIPQPGSQILEITTEGSPALRRVVRIDPDAGIKTLAMD